VPRSESGSRSSQWNFIPELASVAVPQAKVYLKDPADEGKERAPKANTATRYRIGVRVISFDDGVSPWSEVKASLFVVKGNPLLTSTYPLPCFASGMGSLIIDLRDSSEAESLSLQVLLTDLSAHFGLPLEDILDLVDSAGVERTLTLWDTQTGAMRGGCTVGITVDREQPLSVAEIAELRRRGLPFNRAPINPVVPDDPLPPISPSTVTSKQPEDMFSQLSQRASDLLATARSYAGPLEEKRDEKQSAEDIAVPRRRRGTKANFEVNPDVINTVIPE